MEEDKKKHPGGRPTDYSQDVITKTREYIDSCSYELYPLTKSTSNTGESFEYRTKLKFPSIAGLSLHLKVARSTIYLWEKEYQEFSDILEELLSNQEEILTRGGLSGDLNSTISKLVLSKHGYSDRVETDITSKGEKIMPIPIYDLRNNSNPQDSEPVKKD